MLVRQRYQKHSALDQSIVLDQLINQSAEVTFREQEYFPRREELEDIFSLVEKLIQDSDQEKIFIELQVFLILSIIQGLKFKQVLALSVGDWDKIESLNYSGEGLVIGCKNDYCNALITGLGNKDQDVLVFQKLNFDNALECLNLLLVMNGYEYVFTKENLPITFGRFHYLRHGSIRGVRDFLKDYFDCDSHIELLVKLRLVDSMHYNTMVRN
ncbi:MAG: hypothetical protein RIC06_25785 [Cyclobacteriaceae bacterium]